MNQIQILHHHAEELREQEKFDEALEIYAKVIKLYYADKNYSGVADALGGQMLTHKHLFLINKKQEYLDLALGSATASLNIAKKYKQNDILYRCYFRLGEVDMLSQEYKSAIKNYQKAINLYPNINSEKGDFQYHLGEAQYKSGDIKVGLSNLLTGLKTIQEYRDSTDSFLINVWESGCLIKLFTYTKDKKYYNLAKKIIDNDDRLIIRKRQLKSCL